MRPLDVEFLQFFWDFAESNTTVVGKREPNNRPLQMLSKNTNWFMSNATYVDGAYDP